MSGGKFRLACSIEAYLNNPDKSQRPPMPEWLVEDRSHLPYNESYSWRYWRKIYWATPPWITKEMITEMKRIYERRPEGFHVDHITPLNGGHLGRGLHVPWNLQYLRACDNLNKSNLFWPDHPLDAAIEQLELFIPPQDLDHQHDMFHDQAFT